MQTFTLEIDEEQLAIMVAAMKHLPKTEEAEVELLSMLEDLPRIEALDPGLIHGLCY